MMLETMFNKSRKLASTQLKKDHPDQHWFWFAKERRWSDSVPRRTREENGERTRVYIFSKESRDHEVLNEWVYEIDHSSKVAKEIFHSKDEHDVDKILDLLSETENATVHN